MSRTSSVALTGLPVPVPPAVVVRDANGQTTVRVTRITTPIVIDGALDEEAYTSVLAVSDFIQQEPKPGAPATEKTDVWFFSDGENLYVSARCWDSHPEREVVGDMRRDGESQTSLESIMLAIDTYHDRRNGYSFGVNSNGGMADSQVTNERDSNRDWNTVWDARVGRFENGWTVEIVVPFKSVRYSPDNQDWGVQVRRVVRWKNELSYITAVPASSAGAAIFKFSSAATLVGMDLPGTSRNIEVKPYGLSGLRTDRKASPPTSNDFDRAAGIDVKYGVTRSLTADFTYRTDFAQVEDDGQQINLTRFNVFYPEKREFFLEGQGIFASGGGGSSPGATPIIFFTRRIGLDNGRPIPIQAGGRLTGKAGPYTIGLLNVETGDEPVAGAQATNFTVMRVKRDILRRSSIGTMFTRRSVSRVGPGSNEAYAVDGVFSFFQNLRLNSYLARTRTPGLSRRDTSYRAQLDYTGDRYGAQIERLVVGEHFNPEVGFLQRKDFVRHFASARFSPRPRSMNGIRKFSWEASYNQFDNGRGRLETRQVGGVYRILLQRGDQFNLEYGRSYELLQTPFGIASNVKIPVGGYTFQEIRPSYDFGNQRKLSGNLGYEQGSFYDGHRKAMTYSVGRIKVSPMLTVYPGFSVNWVDLPQGQFTTRLASLRALYTITPRMFVTTFAQYNSDTHTASLNLRLRWEYRPSSELFVVYNEGRSTLQPGHLDVENRAFVVKLTRLFPF